MTSTVWMPPARVPRRRLPAPGDVHVWLVPLRSAAGVVERCAGLLSTDERERAERFYFERDRRRYVRARAALRAVLGGYLDIDPRDLVFSYGEHGKPALGGPFAGSLTFNVSHSEETALIAVGRHGQIGVDIEAIRRLDDRDDLASRMFSAAESSTLGALHEEHRDVAFFTCWTRKEAYVKAVGDGLALPLDRFTVTFLDGQLPRLTVHDAAGSAKWAVHSLPPVEGYAAALVTDGPRSLTCCQFDERDLMAVNPAIEEIQAV